VLRPDALVVGGTIHTRLAVRKALRAHGYEVTIVASPRGGLAQLGRHDFTLCALDLSTERRARDWRLRYRRTSASRGTALLEVDPALAGGLPLTGSTIGVTLRG
jgi:hypothetical protein